MPAILLVVGFRELRLQLKTKLSSLGYDVYIAEDPDAAISFIQEKKRTVTTRSLPTTAPGGISFVGHQRTNSRTIYPIDVVIADDNQENRSASDFIDELAQHCSQIKTIRLTDGKLVIPAHEFQILVPLSDDALLWPALERLLR